MYTIITLIEIEKGLRKEDRGLFQDNVLAYAKKERRKLQKICHDGLALLTFELGSLTIAIC
jgi:hypothetical protein